jgi:uncharacterized membrane protein
MPRTNEWGWRDDARGGRRRTLMTVATVAGAAGAAIWAAQRFGRTDRSGGIRAGLMRDVHVRKTYTINRQPDVVYGFWRKLENLPRFMKHLDSVEVIGDRRSRWRAKGPAGFTVEWEAEIVDERPNERIAWRSLEGSPVPNRGAVRFDRAPGSRGTELRVELFYEVPGGRAAQLIGKLFGEEPELQITEDLRRLKQILEAGEIAVGGDLGYRRRAQQPSETPAHHSAQPVYTGGAR